MRLGENYAVNVRELSYKLNAQGNFDIIERHLSAGGKDFTFFFIDGFIKDGEMQRVMQNMLSMTDVKSVYDVEKRLPYVEVKLCSSVEEIICAVLSGQSVILGESFGGSAILVDARTYPARSTEEPTNDRVMQGAKDGFVETLVMNTALIRRRIRDPRLTMEHFNLGGASATDVVMCYMRGVAEEKTLEKIREKLRCSKPESMTLGFRSLSETLIRKGWWNPFPKIRTTERPDTASAQVLEGSILLICDTSPQVIVLPTSLFSYIQQTDDYYFPPLTGTYLRFVRTAILLLSVIVTPVWYLLIRYADTLPEWLSFIVPDNIGALPIILQLLIVEVAIDGLKIASLNTPDMLSSSLSVIGALILGDFAVEVGWLCEDVILYMAFVAVASFAQQNAELGYAFKFIRIVTLIFVLFFDWVGLLLGLALFLFEIFTNKTVCDDKSYLYPLIPFDGKALLRMVFRMKKNDFKDNLKSGEKHK